MEWTSPLNPFNSLKALVWSDKFKKLASGQIPNPVSVCLDLTNECNVNCLWCNSKDYRKKYPGTVSLDDVKKLARVLMALGVKGICVGGGGEPTLHPEFEEIMRFLSWECDFKLGVITNGTMLHDKSVFRGLASYTKWVGVSVDAGINTTWRRVKRPKDKNLMFSRIIFEMRELAQHTRLSYKYLLHPINAQQTEQAVSLAKFTGCEYIHFRPVDMPKLDFAPETINSSLAKIEEARKLYETDKFKVLSIQHKFNSKWKAANDFKKCRTVPLAGTTFGADGNIWACPDRRGDESLLLGKWDETQYVFGSKKHKKILNGVNVKKCGRCTYSGYEKILDNVFIKDKMDTELL
jgi:wyosine [tRNA(Phe)-imidazoG37] synthetase (radical SAM superfamily)